MATAYLGFGSNLGDKEMNIREAARRLGEHPGIRVRKLSSLYETAPIGYTDQPDFVNAAAEVETDLAPEDLLRAALDIEKTMGRERNIRWGPRVIDIDILLYNSLHLASGDLAIPHPRMLERAFVLAPLAEIAPDLQLPDGRKPGEALEEMEDQEIRCL